MTRKRVPVAVMIRPPGSNVATVFAGNRSTLVHAVSVLPTPAETAAIQAELAHQQRQARSPAPEPKGDPPCAPSIVVAFKGAPSSG